MLYRLPELIGAAANRIVFVVEGEKDADTLVDAGFVATCNPGGARKWRSAYNKYLADRRVVVLADEDEDGISHAEEVAESLAPVARWVRLVRLPGLSDGGDVTDWLSKGHTAEELWELVRQTPLFSGASGPSGSAENGNSLRFYTAAEICRKAKKQIKWIVLRYVAAGCITLIIGKVKAAGKTTLITYLARAVLDGCKFLGLDVSQTNVVYLTEQPVNSFYQALERAGLLRSKSLRILFAHNAMGKPWTDIVKRAIEECKRRKAQLLVVDTLAAFANIQGGGENDAGHALEAMKPLQDAAHKENIAVIAVQHERKGGGEVVEAGRGSTAFAGAADIVVTVSRLNGRSRPTLRELKAESRFTETPASMLIELTDDGYMCKGQVRALAEEEAELGIVDTLATSKAEAMGIEEITKAAGCSRATAQRVLERLCSAGHVKTAGKGAKGSPKRYWRRQ